MFKHILNRLPLYRQTGYRVILRGICLFFAAKILKRPVLKYMDIALDYSCNMKCEHCFAISLKGEGKKRLTIEQYRAIAKVARSAASTLTSKGASPS